jgi:hypothetical protein
MLVKKQTSFPFFRSVKARMEQRYIFNYRIKPEELAKKLPVPWLEPQVVNGWSVVSFCILWLKNLSVVPFPAVGNMETISCAYRIGVIDTSGDVPEPSVYVTDRWADFPLIARIAPWILLDTVPIVKASLGSAGNMTQVQMNYLDGTLLFAAEATPAAAFQSEMFDSVDDFAKLIKNGVSSYATSIYEGAFTKVDLYKEDVAYEPLEAIVEYSELNQYWHDSGMVLDSAVRARGAEYKWTYRGLWST